MITWKDIDNLENRKASGETIYIKPYDYKELATITVTAHFEGFVTRFDSTYLIYSYLYSEKEYHFGWETPFDETHRGHDRGNKTWYDEINTGEGFTVRILTGNYQKHFIVDDPFNTMNSGVYCFTYLE